MSQIQIEKLARKEALQLGVYNAGMSDDAVRETWQVDHITRLGSNENPLGASPLVAVALRADLGHTGIYSDSASLKLRHALAELTSAEAGRIVIGNGSEELLKLLCLAFINPGERVVTLEPSFGLHQIYPQMMGAQVELVPVNQQMEFDLPAWQQALSQPTKMLILSNPSNPVGCMLCREDFTRLIEQAPQDCILVIDEAYYEYCHHLSDYPDSLNVLAAQPRPWIVLRTFSKAWGLAGLRVGYGIASDEALAGVINRVRTPFNINRSAQAAALAALQDPAHVAASVALIAGQRELMRQQLIELGYQVAPSVANFLFFRAGGDSRDLAKKLLEHGIIVKPWREAGYTDWVRVSVGSPEDNLIFINALRGMYATQCG
ncbi:histidinol-phosphate transaminase [Erwinia sp. S43]|uniref:histidinol-phosphate transaminase n=1 Tax=unclassified Erwinia TaxID=2622719 RepID=UPI0019093299|nr:MULTISPECIES: histidinol-phosphate transaminase [unclassified Erwinia]MBK0034049.1 histidinol-phosphate transaminase [Erwinia sp. S43]MCW1873275.1 histidinol-phosphate transaminase [Erwinia sp. INIA01]